MRRIITLIILVAALCGISYNCQAKREEVDIWVSLAPPIGEHPMPRSPIFLPTLYRDGYTLFFEDLYGDYQLQIIQNGSIVYSTAVYDGTTETDLPQTLSGSYELRLVAETFYYYGYIDL